MSAALLVLAYLLGSVPWAVLVVKFLHGIDVRETGSGNVGARNSMRVGGPVAGGSVLLLDALKGAIPPWLAQHFALGGWIVALAATLVILGHCFSIFMLLRLVRLPWQGWRMAFVRAGGMGLASAFGVLLVLAPWTTIPTLLCGILVLRRSPAGTGSAMTMVFAGIGIAWLLGYPPLHVLGIALMGVIIIIKHLPDLIPLKSRPES